ncbi:MAG: NepR family anti-sigma factor [Pseudomonadota bacterium]
MSKRRPLDPPSTASPATEPAPQIDAALKVAYQQTMDEAIPDHLAALLEKLKAQGGRT